MLLTITSTAPHASDLGYLLHKHPDRVQCFEESVGRVHVFYPEAGDDRCTAAVLLEVDPVGLVRGRRPGGPRTLAEYVNDRPYAASSMLAVALGRVFKTALSGRCAARPELAGQALPLEIRLPALPCRGGAEVAQRVFAPLGWQVEVGPVPLDPAMPGWGDSDYVALRLTGEHRLAGALGHLYVLLPVLDDSKHYWVGEEEVDKLLRAAGGWLPDHPARELITRRYLVHQRSLVSGAAERLSEAEAPADPSDDTDLREEVAEQHARRASLAATRREAVVAALRETGASRVVDLGCGEGRLLKELLGDPRFTEVVGADVSDHALRRAERTLGLERLPDSVRARVRLFQSALTYRDQRLAGFDAAVLMEVVEHVDPPRLPVLESAVFGHARPSAVVVTTPNAEHNVRFPWLAEGGLRHPDHRFEWTRAEFRGWAGRVAQRTGYRVSFRPVGTDDPEVGPPTQLAIFEREAHA